METSIPLKRRPSLPRLTILPQVHTQPGCASLVRIPVIAALTARLR